MLGGQGVMCESLEGERRMWGMMRMLAGCGGVYAFACVLSERQWRKMSRLRVATSSRSLCRR